MQELENFSGNYDDLVNYWEYLKKENLISHIKRFTEVEISDYDIEILPPEIKHSNFVVRNAHHLVNKVDAVIIVKKLIIIINTSISYTIFTKIIQKRTIQGIGAKIKPLPYSIDNEIFYTTRNVVPLKHIIAYVKDNDDISKYFIHVEIDSGHLNQVGLAIVAVPYECKVFFQTNFCNQQKLEKLLRDCVYKYTYNLNQEKLMKVAKFITSSAITRTSILSILDDINNILLVRKSV